MCLLCTTRNFCAPTIERRTCVTSLYPEAVTLCRSTREPHSPRGPASIKVAGARKTERSRRACLFASVIVCQCARACGFEKGTGCRKSWRRRKQFYWEKSTLGEIHYSIFPYCFDAALLPYYYQQFQPNTPITLGLVKLTDSLMHSCCSSGSCVANMDKSRLKECVVKVIIYSDIYPLTPTHPH